MIYDTTLLLKMFPLTYHVSWFVGFSDGKVSLDVFKKVLVNFTFQTLSNNVSYVNLSKTFINSTSLRF